MKYPVYVRITVDGLAEELSLTMQVLPTQWDEMAKQVTPGHPQWKAYNKKIHNARTDIERHFDLMQIKHGLATAALVRKSYLSPSSAEQLKTENHLNLVFSETLDILVAKYLQFCEKNARLYAVRHPLLLKNRCF